MVCTYLESFRSSDLFCFLESQKEKPESFEELKGMQLQSLGMSSVEVSKLQGHIHAQLGVYVPSADFFESIGMNVTVQEFVSSRLESSADRNRCRSPKTISRSPSEAGGSMILPNASPTRLRRQQSRNQGSATSLLGAASPKEKKSLRKQLSGESMNVKQQRNSPKRLSGLLTSGGSMLGDRSSRSRSPGPNRGESSANMRHSRF